MKKIIVIGIIIGLISGSIFAQTTVSSANVVGYVNVIDPASNKYVLVAAPFNSGTGTVSTLLDIFGTNQLRQNALSVRCDLVIMWDPVAQAYVRYGQKPNGLFYLSTAFSGSPTNPLVTRGQAMWIQSPAAAYSPTDKTVAISGNVPNDGAYTNYIVGNAGKPLNFIANPYPTQRSLNDLINTNHGATANALSVRADQVRVWDNAAQQYLYYGLKLSANTNVNNKWLLTSSFNVTTPPTVTIDPGQGFWYQTTNAFNWVSVKPYTLD